MSNKSPRCVVCKQIFNDRHWYYHQLCQSCGDFNYEKQQATTDLSGKIAVVTGARVNIGYGVCLRLLRSGARVITTTRFPHHAAQKYSQEIDFVEWRDRLQIYPLDLRDLARVEAFTYYIDRVYSHVDIIVNNAAQTIRRPPAYYRHLIELESQPIVQLSAQLQPFVINSRLKGMMTRHQNVDKYIINVSSQEGRFNGVDKPWRHPHTNMAKAALNQMTRTCAKEYAKHRIFMNAVGPGWISFQHPHPIATEMLDRGTEPPFTIIDAAARICAPIWTGLNTGNNQFGRLFKNYQIVDW